MPTKHLNQTKKAVINLALGFRTVSHIGKKPFNDSIEHAQYELNNLPIVVVDIKQLNSLLETWQHKWCEIFHNRFTRAFNDPIECLNEAHDLLDAHLAMNHIRLDIC